MSWSRASSRDKGNADTVDGYVSRCKDAEVVPLSEFCQALQDGLDDLRFKRGRKIGAEDLELLSEYMPYRAFRSLDATGTGLSSDAATAFAGLLRVMDLSSLKLAQMAIGDKGAIKLIEPLPSMPSLTYLDLHSNGLGDQAAKALAPLISQPGGMLTSLCLRDNHIGLEGLGAIALHLKSSNHLAELDLNTNHLGDMSMSLLGAALTETRSLQVLDVGNNMLGEHGVSAVVAGAANSASLAKLVLEGNQIGDGGAHSLGNAIAHGLPHLHTLCLTNCGIGEQGWCHLAACMAGHPRLCDVDLRGSPLGKRGAAATADLMRANTSLERVSLDVSAGDPSLNDPTSNAHTIAEALKGNTSLTSLDVGGAVSMEDQASIMSTLRVNRFIANVHGDISPKSTRGSPTAPSLAASPDRHYSPPFSPSLTSPWPQQHPAQPSPSYPKHPPYSTAPMDAEPHPQPYPTPSPRPSPPAGLGLTPYPDSASPSSQPRPSSALSPTYRRGLPHYAGGVYHPAQDPDMGAISSHYQPFGQASPPQSRPSPPSSLLYVDISPPRGPSHSPHNPGGLHEMQAQLSPGHHTEPRPPFQIDVASSHATHLRSPPPSAPMAAAAQSGQQSLQDEVMLRLQAMEEHMKQSAKAQTYAMEAHIARLDARFSMLENQVRRLTDHVTKVVESPGPSH
ncbi:hypothetical protein CYMTET_54976 [Cymbomonas tetramitiformis]|uniref:RNI-like protein n=1 Tax=Cymbomonas tetramitiformis TaxID=36881 RepID=A0AAE0BE39_9CHLO|nr:hypothetical protein CYMTET_54976 [Cymbomonas tetramitiformis]